MTEEKCLDCEGLEQELEVAQDRIKELEKLLDESAFAIKEIADEMVSVL